MLPTQYNRPTDIGLQSPDRKQLVLGKSQPLQQVPGAYYQSYEGSNQILSNNVQMTTLIGAQQQPQQHTSLLGYPMTPKINSPGGHFQPQLDANSTVRNFNSRHNFQNLVANMQSPMYPNVRPSGPDLHSRMPADDNLLGSPLRRSSGHVNNTAKQYDDYRGNKSNSPLRRNIFDDNDEDQSPQNHNASTNRAPILGASPDTKSAFLRSLGKYTSQIQNPVPSQSPLLNVQPVSVNNHLQQGLVHTTLQNQSIGGSTQQPTPYPQYPQQNLAYNYGPSNYGQNFPIQAANKVQIQSVPPTGQIIPSTGSSSEQVANPAWKYGGNYSGVNLTFGQISQSIASQVASQSPKQDTPHHGKSKRSIQLFENEESHAYPRVTHVADNKLVRAQSLERADSLSALSLDIHEDSCYNFLNKRRYNDTEECLTPLEEFFHKESVAQYKVAQFLGDTHALSPVTTQISMRRTKKYLLVLDIDETLVHSEPVVEQSIEKPEFKGKIHDRYIEFPNPNGTVDVYGVRFRPHLLEFLDRMSKVYDLAVYTASARDYADAVVDQLDPTNTKFVARLYREHCAPVNNMNIKNMAMFPGDDSILVDNLIYSYSFQLNRGIPICPFVDDKMDVELRDLATILERIDEYQSIHQLLQDLLGLDEFYKCLEKECEDPQVEITPTVMAGYTHSNQQHSKTAQGNTISLFKHPATY